MTKRLIRHLAVVTTLVLGLALTSFAQTEPQSSWGPLAAGESLDVEAPAPVAPQRVRPRLRHGQQPGRPRMRPRRAPSAAEKLAPAPTLWKGMPKFKTPPPRAESSGPRPDWFGRYEKPTRIILEGRVPSWSFTQPRYQPRYPPAQLSYPYPYTIAPVAPVISVFALPRTPSMMLFPRVPLGGPPAPNVFLTVLPSGMIPPSPPLGR